MDPNPDSASPRPTSGFFGGRRSPSLVSDQEKFRATTPQIIKIETPQFKDLPQDTQTAPPMPPRPPATPELPPRNSLRRQSTVPHTRGPSDFPSQSQPPNVMRMPTPLPQGPLRSTPPPMPSRQPTLGGGVSGFAHTSGDTRPLQHGSADISRGAKVWHTYNTVSQKFDGKRLETWNENLNALLLFVSLTPGGGLSGLTRNT